jgi:hypothetical protein
MTGIRQDLEAARSSQRDDLHFAMLAAKDRVHSGLSRRDRLQGCTQERPARPFDGARVAA